MSVKAESKAWTGYWMKWVVLIKWEMAQCLISFVTLGLKLSLCQLQTHMCQKKLSSLTVSASVPWRSDKQSIMQWYCFNTCMPWRAWERQVKIILLTLEPAVMRFSLIWGKSRVCHMQRVSHPASTITQTILSPHLPHSEESFQSTGYLQQSLVKFALQNWSWKSS